jgi:hypothetical protein
MDQYPDILIRYVIPDGLNYSPRIRWYSNNGAGGPGVFALKNQWECDWFQMDSGDINGDGLQDVIGVGYPSVWLERLTMTGWQSHALTPVLNTRRFVDLVDLDQDGDLDYIGADGTSGILHLRWFENQGAEEDNWVMHTIQQGGIQSISSLDVSDYDSDGDYDIVCGSESDEFYLFVNQGLTDGWTLVVIQYPSVEEFERVTFADLDGISHLELLTTDWFDSDVLYFQESSPGNWTPHVITSYPYKVLYAASGDIDADGDQDVAVTAHVSGSNPYYLMWYENLNRDASEWIFHPVITDQYPHDLAVADFNQDGRDDLLCCYDAYSSSSREYVLWWDMLPGMYHSGQCLLESSILHVDGGVSWSTLDWNATLPSQTTVKFQVRSSDDPSDMGPWSSNIISPGSITAHTTSGDAYFQYRAILETLDPTVTPALNSVTVSWNPVGIEEGGESSEVSMELVRNPAVGLVELHLSLPSLMHVRLDVFDVSGRLVARVLDGELEQGSHTIQVTDLAPGLYLALLVTGSELLVERVTVIGR